MADFESILNQASQDIKIPPLLPPGVYRLVVDPEKPYELIESSQKKTPGVQVYFRVVAPYKVPEEEELDGIDISKRRLSEKFWMTEDAQGRLTESFMKEALEMEFQEGEQLRDSLGRMGGHECYGMVVKEANQSGDRFYNNVGKFFSMTAIHATEV